MPATPSIPNVNCLWGEIVAGTLSRLGVRHAVIAPGSRSAPLVWGLTRQEGLTAISVLDERSAAFYALGLARASGRPVALVCTSGTAAANFFPAVIEASLSGVPLLVLTADRPPELRDCHAGQAIDQTKIYGHYPRWQHEVALPENRLELLRYLRQTMVHAWERAQHPWPGPVHLNFPFREPLAPVTQPGFTAPARVDLQNILGEAGNELECSQALRPEFFRRGERSVVGEDGRDRGRPGATRQPRAVCQTTRGAGRSGAAGRFWPMHSARCAMRPSFPRKSSAIMI